MQSPHSPRGIKGRACQCRVGRAWHEHVAWSGDGTQVIGLTPCGRATVLALKLNNDDMVVARRLWVSVGWHPPDD
jgi:hypothetical protein